MSVITAKGQTVELAVEDALRQLNTSKDRVDINIVDEGKRGFLGLFGNRPAVVVVVLKKDPNQGVLPKYTAGLYVEQNTSMVVSRGLGNSIIPQRILNRPEIV
ncbi:Jag N-terminal domain-containing protein, partial [Bacillus sp. HC-Mk]